MRLLFVALLTLLAAPAAAQTTTWSIVTSNPSSLSADDVLKGVGVEVTDASVVDSIAPYFTTSGYTVEVGIWEETSVGNWSNLWSDSLYVSSSGYNSVTVNYPLSAGETYLFGYWSTSTMGYHWSSASQSSPAWGDIDGRVTYNTASFPTTFSRAYDSTVGGYRMQVIATTTTDGDLDGYDADEDCDDTDPNTNPGAIEICDGADNDCDGSPGLDELDSDFDGWLECGGDCDDFDGNTWPGAPEYCDAVDNDCDFVVDEDLTFDGDGDGFTSIGSCEGSADDCDDTEPATNPDAPEVCDYLDNDCDGDLDEGFDYDGDNDFFTNGDCAGGDDCDDTNPLTFPGAPEQCDGEDNDCDGAAPDDELVDDDADGITACTDCDDDNPDVFPGQAEDCSNGIDDNCNGDIDESGDEDGDGFGACDDCDDTNADVNPGADEDECNEVDDDCDGDLHPLEEDDDNDGFLGCEGDCDDDNDLVYPGAEEVCDGFDNDCDGEMHPEEGDENDNDGDGIPICFDCDDEDETIYPGADEDPCGEVDEDCDGVIPDGSDCGDDDDDDDGGGGGGGRSRGGCSCASVGGAAGLPALLLLLARRRREPASPQPC